MRHALCTMRFSRLQYNSIDSLSDRVGQIPVHVGYTMTREDGMGLIWINDVSIGFGGALLLDGVSLQIEAGERIGLLGRNGSGKSTLMKLLVGDIAPDKGQIVRSGDVKIAMLPQDVPDDLPGTVYDVVASGSQEHVELLHEYHELTIQLQIARGADTGLMRKLEEVQHRIEACGAWHYHQRVETVLAKD